MHYPRQAAWCIKVRRDRFQVSLLRWTEFKQINWLLFLPRFSDDFRVNKGYLIRLNLINIRREIWGWTLKMYILIVSFLTQLKYLNCFQYKIDRYLVSLSHLSSTCPNFLLLFSLFNFVFSNGFVCRELHESMNDPMFYKRTESYFFAKQQPTRNKLKLGNTTQEFCIFSFQRLQNKITNEKCFTCNSPRFQTNHF